METDTDKVMQAPVCEHYFEYHMLGGEPVSVGVCRFCRDINWPDLRLSLDNLLAAATARAERAEAANEDLTLAVKARDIAVREADRLRAVAETAIARVRHLHQPYRGVPDFDICAACSIGLEVRAWPCPTIAALDGTDNTGHAPGCLGDRGIVHQTCPACTAGGTE